MSFKLKFVLIILIFLWLAGIFVEWLIPLWDKLGIAFPFLKHAYSHVCHQESAKLIVEGGKESLVCSRCVGIYSGFFLTSLAILIAAVKKPGLKLFGLVALPMLLDVLLYSIGVYPYSRVIAFLTGLLLGSAGFLYFYSALIELFNQHKVKSN